MAQPLQQQENAKPRFSASCRSSNAMLNRPKAKMPIKQRKRKTLDRKRGKQKTVKKGRPSECVLPVFKRHAEAKQGQIVHKIALEIET